MKHETNTEHKSEPLYEMPNPFVFLYIMYFVTKFTRIYLSIKII
jgi:hypothetical protein